MTRPILALQHNAVSPPGYFAEFLARRGVPLMTVLVRSARDLPTRGLLEEVAGVALFGGDASLTAPPAWLSREVDLAAELLATDVPLLGHCLGGQILAAAAGARVARAPAPEIGWLPLAMRPEAAATDWLSRLGARTPHRAFFWHEDVFDTPCGALPLLSSPRTSCQAFVLGRSLAVQFHPEITLATYRGWLPIIMQDLPPPSAGVQSAAELAADPSAAIAAARVLSDRLYEHWLASLDTDPAT